MRLEKTEAIVLQTFPSRERDKLVVFLTPGQGKKRGWAYGARSLKSRFGAALEPLSKVRIGYAERESEEVVRIESIELLRSLFDVHRDLGSSLAATYLAELVDTFAQAGDPAELIFRLLDRTSEALAGGSPPAAVIAYADIWVLKLGGVLPSLRNCLLCDAALQLPLRFDSHHLAFVCASCAGPSSTIVPNDVTETLGALLRLPVDEFAALPHQAEELFEIRSLARTLRRAFLGYELKSHDLLGAAIGS